MVDCGGGTVDITVHEVLDSEHRRLKEVYKASGGPYGSVGQCGTRIDYFNLRGSQIMTIQTKVPIAKCKRHHDERFSRAI